MTGRLFGELAEEMVGTQGGSRQTLQNIHYC